MKKNVIIDMLQKIYKSFDKKQRKKILFLTGMIFLSVFFELLCVPVVLPLVDLATAPESISENTLLRVMGGIFELQTLEQYTIFALVLIILVYVIKNIITLLLYKVQYHFIYRGQQELSERIMCIYLYQDYLFHVNHNVSELQRDISTDVTNFYTTILTIVQLFTELMVCFALAVYLIVQDWSITLITLGLLTLFLGAFLYMYRKRLECLGIAARKDNATTNMWLLQSFGGIKEIKTNNKEEYFLGHYAKANRTYMAVLERQQRLTNMPRPIMEGLTILVLLSCLLVRMLITGDGGGTLATLSVFAVAAFRLLPSFNRITGYLTTISYYRASVDAVHRHLEMHTQMQQFPQKKCKEFDLQEQIEMRSVDFTYPGTDTTILSHADIHIFKNQSIALIGPSGAGKSTLADIILGVLKPQNGGVYIDGQNICDNLPAWYKIVGYIPQTIYLLDDTIEANIAFGIPREKVNKEQLYKAIEEAQLDDFITSLEEGIDTKVGEQGVRLSGGQRQRIGIARALYRKPQILLLDEATSALDSETEQAVMQAIERLQGQKTMIIIAHRLTTIRHCDEVYEVKDQRVKKLSEKERRNLAKPV